jgi:50S ribosomal protein L16 3-hydroxylase
MDARRFLRDYWQKRPLLMRRAVPGIETLFTREKMFALARRPSIESRLVLERGSEYPWQVLHGPFSAARLRALPRAAWSLLVQGVNFEHVRAADLLARFAFIPNWRVDDLMVSVAPDGGSVGAHVDSYDVFLLQAAGRRRWRINSRRYHDTDFVPGLDLRILRNFRHTREWLLGPGDMLYLPPGVAHHGVAVGDSITCSVGFRAPSGAELLAAVLDAGMPGERRLSDANLALQRDPGEITRGQLAALRALVRGALPADAALDRWLARHLTELPPTVSPPAARPIPFRDFCARLRRGSRLRRAPRTRAAFMRDAGGVIYLYLNGAEFALHPAGRELAARVAGAGPFPAPARRSAADCRDRRLLHGLYQAGLLQFAD